MKESQQDTTSVVPRSPLQATQQSQSQQSEYSSYGMRSAGVRAIRSSPSPMKLAAPEEALDVFEVHYESEVAVLTIQQPPIVSATVPPEVMTEFRLGLGHLQLELSG